MSFLTPLFLLGLAALAVPVLIHLTQRERKSVVEFPSLMFLRKIPYESVQRRRIRDWLLLALRLAALALIVAAFARPFLRGSELAAAPGGARDIVVLLDRSYSMGYGDSWSRAQRAAAQAIEQRDAGRSHLAGAVCRQRGGGAAIDAGSLARGRRDQRRVARARARPSTARR